MKTTITLAVISFLFIGCAVGSFPRFPDQIKNQYTVDIVNQPQPQALLEAIVNIDDIPDFPPIIEMDLLTKDTTTLLVRCLEFEIVSKAPYKIKFIKQVDLAICNGVTGFKPKDAINIFNWMDDVYEWAKDRKKCFK